MTAAPPNATIARTLWAVTLFGREQYPPGRGYWWDNHRRTPAGINILQLTTAGRMALRHGRKTTTVAAGQLAIMRLGEKTSYGKASEADNYACQWINASGAGLNDHLDAFRQRHGPVVTIGERGSVTDHFLALRSLVDPKADTPLTTVAQALHTFIIMLFEHADRRLLSRLTPVEQAVDQLVRNPYRPWSLKRLAADVGCSREHLSRVFHQRVGTTPHRFLTDARLRRALDLIRNTGIPMSDVAEHTGFPSARSLARHIHQHTGQSPTALRATP